MTSASIKRLSEQAYWWGSAAFALLFGCALAALPRTIRCCSAFTADEPAVRSPVGWEAPGPAITIALMDWPMGFRLLLMTLAATTLCTPAMIVMALAVRYEIRDDATAAGIRCAIIVRMLVSSMVVGLLYLLTIYAIGLFGAGVGAHNLAWMLGTPIVVAWMGRPSLLGCALGFPLAITGWFCLGILSMTLQIPLD